MPSQARQRRQRRRSSDGGDWIRHCSTVPTGPHVDATNKALRNNTSEKTNTDRVLRSRRTTANQTWFRQNTRLCRQTLPEMPEELLLEILARLPVKSLLRFKCVCKTWCATISGPSFIGMHLQRSVSDHQRQPSFLITPHLLDPVIYDVWPKTFSNNICFYRWHKGLDSASLVYARDFQGEFASAYMFAHCNGLVLLPTDNKMYVLNPATRDLVTLPESPRRVLMASSFCRATVGFGLDPCTNKYKVVQCYRHPSEPSLGGFSTRMEVFTIDNSRAAGSWRDTVPPYPIMQWQTALFFKGSLFWMLSTAYEREPPVTRLLRFCLQAETFSFTVHPPCPALDHQDFDINELDGELCLAQFESSQRMTIWMTNDGANPEWDRRYILDVGPSLTIAISHYGMLLKNGNHIFQYNLLSHNTVDVARVDALRYQGPGTGSIEYTGENLFFFEFIPYTESLVPIAGAR